MKTGSLALLFKFKTATPSPGGQQIRGALFEMFIITESDIVILN